MNDKIGQMALYQFLSWEKIWQNDRIFSQNSCLPSNFTSVATFTSIYVTLSVFWCVLMSFDDVLYIPTGLSYQLSSASTHSLPSRIDQLSDSENDFDIEEDDSSSALGIMSFLLNFLVPKYAHEWEHP